MALKPKSIEETAEEALGPENMADLHAQLAALRADLAALATILTNMAKTGSDTAKQAASDAYADLKANGGEAVNDAATQAEQALASVTDHARKNPLQSLGIAAGIGMVLGLLMGRR